jgi:hypothetical protein
MVPQVDSSTSLTVEWVSEGMEVLEMQAAAQEGREEAPWGAPHHPRFPVFFFLGLLALIGFT